MDAADLPESLRAQLQALESARSRKRYGAGGGDGDEDEDEEDDDDDDDDEPALVRARDGCVRHAACCMYQVCCHGLARSPVSCLVHVEKWRDCCHHSLCARRSLT